MVVGTEKEGPLKIEIAVDSAIGNDASIEERVNIRAFDLTVEQSHKEIAMKPGRKLLTQGLIYETNKGFIDPETGKGIVANAWAKDPIYRSGIINKGNLNTCNSLVTRVLEGIDCPPNNELKEFFALSDSWSEQFNDDGIQSKISNLYHDTATNVKSKPARSIFKIHSVTGCGILNSVCTAEVALQGKAGTHIDSFSEENEMTIDPISSTLPQAEIRIEEDGDLAPRAVSEDAIGTKDGGSKISLARVDGTLLSFTAVSKSALTTLGIAGSIVGAVFVILDFVDHNWVGGAIGGVGLAASIAAGFTISGPVGWVVGGIIAALFAILPSLFKDTHPAAATSDTVGIIQWKFFGDKGHTGNEQCQRGTNFGMHV